LEKRKIYKAKKRKLEYINTHQSCPNSQKTQDAPSGSRLSKIAPVTLGLLCFTRPSEPISAQARSHLNPSKLG